MVLTLQAGAETAEFEVRGVPIAPHGRAFRVVDDPVVLAAADQFTDRAEAGILRLFDAVLPDCDRVVDFGAYVGLTALYAATYVPRVFASRRARRAFPCCGPMSRSTRRCARASRCFPTPSATATPR